MTSTEHNRQRREQRIAKGICAVCGLLPLREGYKTCGGCGRKAVDVNRRVQQRKKAAGLCTYSGCHELFEQGHTMCSVHLLEMRVRARERQIKRLASKTCVDCGARPGWWGVRCILCRTNYVQGSLPTGARRALRRYRRITSIQDRRVQARAILPLVTERERTIFTLRHGLSDGIDRTLEEIASVFSITRERIRQLEEDALFRLQSEGHSVDAMRWPFATTRISKGRVLTPEEQAQRKETRRVTTLAIKAGKIVRKPCEVCGKKADAHHTDYADPYQISWLCRRHHIQAHGKKIKTQKAKARRRKSWIKGLGQPEIGRYPVHRIRDALLRDEPKKRALAMRIGICNDTLINVLCGRKVYGKVLEKVFQYMREVETQKTERAA